MIEASEVRRRLDAVRHRIESAAEAAHRDPADVRLVAVSKRHSPERIRAAYAAGQRLFGENYFQELEAKAEALADLEDLEWRFIGHLQRNKAKGVVAVGAGLDALDSPRLARELAKRAAAAERTVRVLIQVNVAGEDQKAGVALEEAPALIALARELEPLRLEGLMTIPPAGDPEDARPFFRRLRELAEEHELGTLSMGMSADLEVAIAEGATEVRVGTAVFGPRD